MFGFMNALMYTKMLSSYIVLVRNVYFWLFCDCSNKVIDSQHRIA